MSGRTRAFLSPVPGDSLTLNCRGTVWRGVRHGVSRVTSTQTRHAPCPHATTRLASTVRFGTDPRSDSPASPVTPTARRPASLRLQSTVEDETHPAARSAASAPHDLSTLPRLEVRTDNDFGGETVRTAGLHMCTQSLPWVLWTISHTDPKRRKPGARLDLEGFNRREPPRRRVSPPPSHIAVQRARLKTALRSDAFRWPLRALRKLVSRLERRDMSSRKPAAAE